MKHYFEWLGLFAVSGCLALMINSAAVAHQQGSVQGGHAVLTTEVSAAMCSVADRLNPRR